MNQPFSIENATIVDKEMRGESSLYITALSPELGLIRMMKKISSKKTGTLPDLFDDISAVGETPSPNSIKFLREFSILKHRDGIARSYDSFEQASMLSLTITKNANHIEDTRTLSERLRAALDSIANGAPPQIVRLKFLFLLARDEGYPVKEDFYPKLLLPQRELFSTIIKTPSSKLEEFKTRANDLLEKFTSWIRINTDIIE